MLKAIHASEDIVAAREKAIRVSEKLRASRLIKAAELAEAERVRDPDVLRVSGRPLAADPHHG